LVSPVEVEALRFEIASLKEKLKDQKVCFEAQISELTKQRDSLEKQLKSYQSARPLPKVITKKPR
jgi:chaperonin cofactor prefoldin